MANRKLQMTLNGQAVGPVEVAEDLPMIDYLHEYQNLTGSRLGCGQGICHACVVIVDNPDGTSEEVRTCITGAHYFDGKKVRTIEGHAQRDENGDIRELNPIQQKFVDQFAFQCSYCAPGFVNAATVLVEKAQRQPIKRSELEQAIEDSLGHHICRCTGTCATTAPPATCSTNSAWSRRLEDEAHPFRPRPGAGRAVAVPGLRRRRRRGAGQARRIPRPRRRLHGLPYCRGRRAVRRRAADPVAVRHHLRHQHHPGQGTRHRRLQRDEFFAALTEGKRKDGAYLYPAMPYTSYHLIEREDADAIYAYLMAQEPIARPAPQTSLSFPFNVRMGLAGWNLLYGKSVRLQPEEGRSEAWKRGQYMVEVLGHCGECHTPRNLAGALEQDKRLSGGLLNGYLAPSLLPGDLAARGWTQPDLASFLKHGMSAQGSMFNEMFPVVHHSTQHLDDSDLAAMATYLLGDQPPPAKVVQALPEAQLNDSGKRGRQQYLNVCAGCHGGEGEGKPHIAVAMNGNTTLRLQDPRNLLRVIEDGIVEQQFTGFERMQPMPGFAGKLDDEQLTDLLNYLRQTWGGLPGDLGPQQVAQLKMESASAHTVKVK